MSLNNEIEKDKKDRKRKPKGEKKPVKTWRKVLRIILLAILAVIVAGLVYAGIVIAKAPKIDPSKLETILTESTVVYDDQGKELDTVYSDANRDNVTIDKMPKNLQNAFIALEDKSFRKHHGFNFVRMAGAIGEAITHGGRISGTSTITQQLARNLYLKETQYDYSINRKIIEAYYTVILERKLTKNQILEAYMNTIFFGFHSSGVQAASQAYFSKDVQDLSLAQCAALAALPQAPSEYQLVKFIEGGSAAEYKDTLLKEVQGGVYVANDISKGRRETCLKLMKNQGYISEKEYKEAVDTPLKDMLDPNYKIGESKGSYFVDYVIDQVINDLQKEKKWDRQRAYDAVYNGGLKINTTMDSQAQDVIETSFANPNNYPYSVPMRDEAGNVINKNGAIVLYNYDNLFNDDGNFTLTSEEAHKDKDGNLIIDKGNKLNIYETEVNGKTDYSLEFKPMAVFEDGSLYAIPGGYINIPQQYKSVDGDGNLVVSKAFLEDKDYKGFFQFEDNGNIVIPKTSYTLQEKVIQPQAAMTIIDNESGQIKAMVGGRNTTGRKILNRAIVNRQPGSSIKPIGPYSTALQLSVDYLNNGQKFPFKDLGIDKQGSKYWGDYFTAGSIIVDEPTTINGREWPKNVFGGYSGPQTLNNALSMSYNTTAVKVALQAGIENVADQVEKFGITSLVREGDHNDMNAAALALGGMSKGVSTLEMASAYTVFPNNGKRVDPTCYTTVEDSHGKVILKAKPKTHEVLDPGVAYIMTNALKYNVNNHYTMCAIPGTGSGGKTGTTDDNYDVWFDGFTPKYSASLWIGNDNNIPLSEMSTAAAQLWGNIMRQINASYEGRFKDAPDNIISVDGNYYVKGTETGRSKPPAKGKTVKICTDTGLLATPECPNTEEKYFEKGEEPTTYCTKHKKKEEKKPEEEKKPDSGNTTQKPPENGDTQKPDQAADAA